MSETGKATVGQVSRGVAGLATLATLLATIIVVLLGAFNVVDMEGVVTATMTALAYVVALGTFALSPIVAVGLIAVSLFNAIGVIAIGAGLGERRHCHQRG